jgi:hypothetical protein
MRRQPDEVRIVTIKRSHFKTPRTLDEAEFDNERRSLRPFDPEDRIVLKWSIGIGLFFGFLALIGRLS